MRLERLFLERYGAHENAELRFRADAALHVVVGDNESGKTTTLAAIADALFGFEHRTAFDYLHDQTRLRIGAALQLSDGSRLAFRRKKGKKNTLIDDAERPLGDDVLERWLGGADRALFMNEFGLTAAALRRGGDDLMKAGGRMAESLAAASVGLSVLTQIREKATVEADESFSTRRSSSKIFYLALDRHQAADAKLSAALVRPETVTTAESAALNAKAVRQSLEAEHEENHRDFHRLSRVQRVRPKLMRLDAISAELATDPDLPEAGDGLLRRWRQALLDQEAVAAETAKLEGETDAGLAMLATLAVDDSLLGLGPKIDALKERLGAMDDVADELPRRLAAQEVERANLAASARRLGLVDADALIAAEPPETALVRAQSLVAAHRKAQAERAEAVSRAERARAELNELDARAAEVLPDPEPIKRRLDALADCVTRADRLRRETSAAETERRRLLDAARALDPPAADLDALAAVALPSPADVAAALKRFDTIAAVRKERDLKSRGDARTLRDLEARRVVLGGPGLATPAQWHAARAKRDAAFEHAPDPMQRATRLEIGRLILAADDIAAALLSASDRVGRLAQIDEQLSEARVRLVQSDADAGETAAEEREFEERWAALWRASGVAPAAPAVMARWRETVAELLRRRDAQAEKADELKSDSDLQSEAAKSLHALLAASGATRDAAASVEVLHREAVAWLESLRRKGEAARADDLLRRRAARDAEEASTSVARAEAAALEVETRWTSAVSALGLQPDATVDEAEAALSIWRNVAVPRANLGELVHRIAGMGAKTDAFAAEVTALGRSAPGEEARTTLRRLVGELDSARIEDRKRLELRRDETAREIVRSTLSRRRAAVEIVLQEACISLRLSEIQALPPALDRLDRRAELLLERDALRRDLAEGGDGLDEPTLRSEAEDLPVDELPVVIERLATRRADLVREIGDAAARHRETETALEALLKGRDAVGAAQARAEAADELLRIADRWIELRAVALLAGRVVERHRAARQDPLVARAGELFAIAADGAHSGLVAVYGDADDPELRARDRTGGAVPIAALSEGARDQLFLALRLALLERRTGEPLPFIGDDLLASFDDARAARTLALLAEFGRTRQTILFTHHRHVASLARGLANPAIEVIDMPARFHGEKT